MSPREPAERKIERVLHILAEASREGGASLEGVAADLGVDRDRVLDDLGQVTARAYYQPAEWTNDVDITIEGDRVTVWTTGEFRRPVRLSSREALALTLGLRLLADGADPARRVRLLALAHRLDRALAVAPAESDAEGVAVEAGDPGKTGVLDRLRAAARERRPCRLAYLKPGAAGPEARTLEPWALVYAGGRWYALGRSPEADGVRAFRLDRILDAEPGEGTFEVPADFDPADWVDGEVLYRADDDAEIEAVVRYAPRIARWILESGAGEERPDGSVVVRHRVADPDWLVRHVLAHAPDAEVLEPPALRRLVAERAAAIAGS